MTKLMMMNWDAKPVVVTIEVPTCPIFDFDNKNDTPEYRELVAKGYHPGGHVD